MALELVARDLGGGGQIGQTSMILSMGHVMGDAMVEYPGAPAAMRPDADFFGYGPLYRIYPAEDGFIVLCAPTEPEWTSLVTQLGGELGDDRFSTPEARSANADALAEVLVGVFAGGSAAHWEQTLSAADIGCAEIVANTGALGVGLFDPGGIADELGLMTTSNHPLLEEIPRTRALVTLSRAVETLGDGNLCGQHTEALLTELGYDAEAVEDLRSRGLIG